MDGFDRIDERDRLRRKYLRKVVREQIVNGAIAAGMFVLAIVTHEIGWAVLATILTACVLANEYLRIRVPRLSDAGFDRFDKRRRIFQRRGK